MLNATGGSIFKTDPDSLLLNSGGSFAGTFAGTLDTSLVGSIGNGLSITDTSGNLALGSLTANGPVSVTASTGSLVLNDLTGSTIFAQAGGSGLTLNTGSLLTATAASGDGIVLDAGIGNFVNSSGSATPLAVTGTARYLVYTADSSTVSPGGLVAGQVYGKTYANYPPGSVTQTGNRFLYANAGAPYVVSIDNAIRFYGNANPVFTYLLTPDAGDSLLGSPLLSTSATIASNVGSYAINGATGSLLADSNRGFSFTPGALAITQRPINITANAAQAKIYGNADPALAYTPEANGTNRGLVGTDSFTGTLARAAGENVASYAINQGTLANGNYAISFIGDSFDITQRSLTLTMGATAKTYDGNTSVAVLPAPTFGNVVGGDSANLSLGAGSGSYDTRHAGSGKIVSYSALVLGGSAAGNYSLSGPTASGSGSITPLASIAWTGGGGNSNWSNAANWGGIIVDGGNVLNVNLAGNSVIYDAANGSTSLSSISSVGSFTMAGGTLGIGSLLTTPTYVQTGGLLNGAGSLTVTQSFSKTGGTIALAGPVSITQNSGPLNFVNDAPLTLGTMTAPSGAITIDTSVGGVTIDGQIMAGGTVGISALGSIAQNADIQGQTIDVTSQGGDIAITSVAISTVPTGGTITYSALAGTITSIPANFAGATPTLRQAASVTKVETNFTTVVNEINTAISRTEDALGEGITATLTDLPVSATERSTDEVVLASSTHTIGGEEGSFGGSEQTAAGTEDKLAAGAEDDGKERGNSKAERFAARKKPGQCS